MAVAPESYENEKRQSKVRERGQPVNPLVAVLAVAALLSLVIWLGYVNLFAPPKPAPMDEKGKANVAYIRSLLKASNGDYSKVPEEDRAKLDKMTGGRGGMVYGLYKAGKIDF